MPLGGCEINSSHKGTGLAMLVDVLCGISADGSYGPNTPNFRTRTTPANLAHCYIALDPKRFAPGFEGRLSDLLNHIRNMTPANPELPVLVPGDLERNYMAKAKRNKGIPIFPSQVESLLKLAAQYKIEFFKNARGHTLGPSTKGYVCESVCAKSKKAK